MALALEDAVAATARLIRTIPGLRGAPTEPPEKISAFPFVITYPLFGEWEVRSRGNKVGLHTIAIEIHTARKDLPRDIQSVIPYGELVSAKLQHYDNTFLPDQAGASTCSAVLALRYVFGPLGYVTVPTIGYRFELDIKIEGS